MAYEVGADFPDVIRFLFQDVCALPIITSHRQEMWLGIQINATQWVDRLCGATSTRPVAPNVPRNLVRAAYESLLADLEKLETQCLEQEGVQSPRPGTWIGELLSVRRSIFELHRSRFRGFVRALDEIGDEEVRNELTDRAYNVAELLCLLPNSVLTRIVEFEQTSERLPLTNELAEWLREPAVDSVGYLPTIQSRAQAARDLLVVGYLRYALRVARKYVHQGLDYADLAQEAFIGLMKAAERYNYRENTRFAYYAVSWIWQNIGRAIADQGRTIRLPVHMNERIHRLEEAYKSLADEGRGRPTEWDVLVHLGWLPDSEVPPPQQPEDEGAVLPDSVSKRCQKARKRLQRLKTYGEATVPLNVELPYRVTGSAQILVRDRQVDGIDLSELISDQDSLTLDSVLSVAITRRVLARALATLTSRERDVVVSRLGLRDGRDRTLEEIGQEFGVTRERIRQIEQKALKKLHRTLTKQHLELEDLVPVEEPWVQLPAEVLAYLEKRFGYWNVIEVEAENQEWHELDSLLDQLPGGDWHHSRLGDRVTREEQLEAALRSCAAPSHYLDITEQLNDSLEGEELDEGYVYTLLTKYEETFILLGRGVFSLVQWEQDRAAQYEPSLPFCPSPLPDPQAQNDAFFESVLIAMDVLKCQPKADQFLSEMLRWAGAAQDQPRWFGQSILWAYYLVGVIPCAFCYEGESPALRCTLPQMDIQALRRYCLQRLTERLMAMPEFWWTFQRFQPGRPSALGAHFAEIHPFGLDDTINRLSILTSLGASQKSGSGQYRLTALGEEVADQWKQRPTLLHSMEVAEETQREEEIEFVDLGFW